MDLTLSFDFLGQTRTLAKHPGVRLALRHGQITEAQARLKPWYLRTQFRPTRPFKLSANDDHAIRSAKDILKGRIEKPEQFSQFLATLDARRGVTLGALAAEWFTAGLPFSQINPRDPIAAAHLRATVTRALTWWAKIPAPAAARQFENFAADRIGKTRSGSGRRTVDVQLAGLSSLCQWAVLTHRLETNPFEKRPQYVQDKEIQHCHRFMPDNDDQFHAILRHIWTNGDPPAIVAGAWLCFGALTGLRPHEPGFLLRPQRATQFPAHLESEPDGLIFPMPDGSTRMKVRRGKGGQNPTVTLHPVLAEFLAIWCAWLDAYTPPSQSIPATPAPLFPVTQERLADVLRAAVRALKLREMHPHGFMRAYYVRVQKSAGKDPATVAGELGQCSGGSLIRSVYGNPNDPLGGNLHDWLPSSGEPAWNILKREPVSNIINL